MYMVDLSGLLSGMVADIPIRMQYRPQYAQGGKPWHQLGFEVVRSQPRGSVNAHACGICYGDEINSLGLQKQTAQCSYDVQKGCRS